MLYFNCSVTCFDDVRCVISNDSVRSEVVGDYDYWRAPGRSTNPIKSLLEAYRCSSANVWDLKSLAAPYYGMLVLYTLGLA